MENNNKGLSRNSTQEEALNTQSTNNSMISSLKSEFSGNNTDSDNVFIIDSVNNSPKKRNSIKDFELINVLGRGSYAKVVLARNIYTNKYYALKVIDKLFLEKVRNIHKINII
jgi:hypothetical protein